MGILGAVVFILYMFISFHLLRLVSFLFSEKLFVPSIFLKSVSNWSEVRLG
jgi:hypothetical protein